MVNILIWTFIVVVMSLLAGMGLVMALLCMDDPFEFGNL